MRGRRLGLRNRPTGDGGRRRHHAPGRFDVLYFGHVGGRPSLRPHGLFVADTRMLSCWRLTVDGAPVQNLSTVEEPTEPYRASFIGRTPPRQWTADSPMLVLRNRFVGDGMREDVVLRNLGAEPIGVTLALIVDTDFADLFAVKEGRVQPPHGLAVDIGAASMAF